LLKEGRIYFADDELALVWIKYQLRLSFEYGQVLAVCSNNKKASKQRKFVILRH
jgi:hypothetical protein